MLFQTNQSIQDNKLKALNLSVESVRAKIRKMIRTQQETFAHKFLNDFEPEVRKFAKNTYEK